MMVVASNIDKRNHIEDHSTWQFYDDITTKNLKAFSDRATQSPAKLWLDTVRRANQWAICHGWVCCLADSGIFRPARLLHMDRPALEAVDIATSF